MALPRQLAKWLSNLLLAMVVVVLIIAFIMPLFFGSKFVIILSGSMGPAIPVGSVVMWGSAEPDAIKVGDAIAFKPPTEPGQTVIHRVIEVLTGESLRFQTKGDANEDPDPYMVPAGNVVGKVRFHLPLVGYLMHYARTRLGFILLLVVPGGILISGEIRKIVATIGSMRRGEG